MRTERRQTERQDAGSPAGQPLTAAERARYEALVAQILEHARFLHGIAERKWLLGQACLEAQKSGLWQRDPAHCNKTFLQYAQWLTNDILGATNSRSTIERAMVMARTFSREQVLSYHARGVCPSVLVEIGHAPEGLRPYLLERALEGKSVREIMELRDTGVRGLELAQEPPQPVDVFDFMDSMLGKLRKRKKGPRLSVENGEDDAAGAPSAEARATLEKERQQLWAEQLKLQKDRDEIAAREQELQQREERQAALAQLHQAAERDGVGLSEAAERRVSEAVAKEAALAVREQAAAAQAAQAEIALQGAAQKEAEAQALTQAAAQQAAELAQKAAGLAQRESELQAREKAQAEEARAQEQRRADLDRREEAVRKEEERLKELPRTLELQQARLSEYESFLKDQAALCEKERQDNQKEYARLQELDRQIAGHTQEVLRAEKQGGLTRLGFYPRDAGSVFEMLLSALDYLCTLVDRGQELLDEHDEAGPLSEVLRTAHYYTLFRERMHPFITGTVQALTDEDPAGVQREFAAYERDNPEFAEALNTGRPREPSSAPRRDSDEDDSDDDDHRGGVAPRRWAAATATATGPDYRVPIEAVLGTSSAATPQHGILGLLPGLLAAVALCLNKAQVINVTGLQNSGKSNTVLGILEMLLQHLKNINCLHKPAGAVAMHFDQEGGPAPGTHKSRRPNTEPRSVDFLRKRLGAGAQGIDRQLVFVPPMNEDRLQQRRVELKCPVEVIGLAMDDVQADDIRMMMAAGDNSSLYMNVVDHLMYELDMAGKLTPQSFWHALETWEFTPQVRALVDARLLRMKKYVLPGAPSIRDKLKPGVLITIDVRDGWTSKSEAMALFAILTRTFSKARDDDGQDFDKVILWDEAHKYMGKSPIADKVVELIRQMRHYRTWLILVSQDVTSLPKEVNELSTVTIVHRLRSKKQHQALIEGNIGWKQVSIEELASLEQGEAYILVAEATDKGWTLRPYKVLIRPTCAMPGGTTRTAVAEA